MNGGLFAEPTFIQHYVTPRWADVDTIANNTIRLVVMFRQGLDALLVSPRASLASFNFKYRYRRSRDSRKDTWMRVLAELRQTEEGDIWVRLSELPKNKRQ